jgi:MarR family transcriptional regulator, lower aerobic nicotinate degradation pathway regulator
MTLKDLYQRPGFLLRRTHQISAAVFENACASVGLTPAQYGVLTVLASEPGLDQTRLARALAFDKVTVMRVCKGLEERGLIERKMSELNRRQMAVVLTPAGKKLLQQARGPAEQAYQRLLSPLSVAQRHQLIEILETLTQGLADEARAPFVPLLPPQEARQSGDPTPLPTDGDDRTNTGRRAPAARRSASK